jgi:hypothetical protein
MLFAVRTCVQPNDSVPPVVLINGRLGGCKPRDMAPMSEVGPTTGLVHRSKLSFYSIHSVAVANSVRGIVSPIAFAVLRLMTNSNVLGLWTGKSAGLAPLRICPT